MKKVIIYFLLFLFLGNPALAGRVMYTSGSGFFAISEHYLIKANFYSHHGNWEKLESLANLGLIKVFPQGTPLQINTYRNGTYRVHFLNSSTIWWTTSRGLMNKQGQNYVR
jgi:hypothetical protein